MLGFTIELNKSKPAKITKIIVSPHICGIPQETYTGHNHVRKRRSVTGEDAPPQWQRQHRVRRVHHEEYVPHESLLRDEIQTSTYEACGRSGTDVEITFQELCQKSCHFQKQNVIIFASGTSLS